MTPDPREHAVSGAVAAATPEISSPVNLSTENELADLNNTRLSDSNGSDTVSNGSSDNVKKFRKLREDGFTGKCWAVISFTPLRCKWDPENPPRFSLGLNILFSFASAASVANIYYNHPILNILAEYFDVTYEEASIIPTVMQAGYATGLLFLCPLGDIFRRRAFVLILTSFTAALWLGLCLTRNYKIFAVISFLTSVTTVTPQLILPLVGDLAPPERRAQALSLVVSGNLGGMLIARLLSGIVTEYSSWRIIYWIALGIQYTIVILMYLFMPDYPVKNKGGLNYFKMLWDLVVMLTKYPVLIQACLVGFFISAIFTSFWTTLTFLLTGPPYHYNSLVIGCFALIGLGAMSLGPPYSKAIIDRFVPLFSTILGELMCLIGVIIGTYTGKFTIAGPIIQAFAIDIGLQTSQIANRTAIYALEPKARNRLNTVYMVFSFTGQLTGTAVGNKLYAQSGWVSSGSASIAFIAASLIVCFANGPWNPGWLGWKGGWNCRRRDPRPGNKEEPAVEQKRSEVVGEGKGGQKEQEVAQVVEGSK